MSIYEECLKDYYSQDYMLDLFESSLLSIEEMCAIYVARFKEDGSHMEYDIDLKQDENTGLYCDANGTLTWSNDLLVNHLIIEQLWAKKEKVDWKRVTECYDYEMIERIKHLLTHPLVWINAEEMCDICVIEGKVAKEVNPPEYWDDDAIYDFVWEMEKAGMLWFADTMPIVSNAPYQERYENMPKDMVLWDRLFHNYSGGTLIQALHTNINYIAENRGGAKAMEIITRFREDWDDIVLLHLFDFDKMQESEIERLRKALFEELDRSMRIWQREAEAAAKQEEKQPKNAVQCRYIDKDKLAETGIHTLEQFTTMLRQACEQDAKALAAFLTKYFKMGYLDFHGDGKKKIYEHLKECFPGAIKYSYPNFTQYFD